MFNLSLNRKATSLLVFALLAGCDASVYQSIPTKDGEVFVLNRFTGNARVTDSDNGYLNPMANRTARERRVTCRSEFPAFAVQFDVAFRPIGGTVYYRARVTPSAAKGRRIDKQRWISHMATLEDESPSPRINISFLSSDEFVLLEEPITLAGMTKVIDDQGEIMSYDGYGQAEPNEAVLNAIAACKAGFSGFSKVDDALAKVLTAEPSKAESVPSST